jgi:hypothetical protein
MSAAKDQEKKGSDKPELDPYFKFRRCKVCASKDMAPVGFYREEGMDGITSFGQLYECPQCQAQVKIRAISAFIAGTFMALFGAAIFWWGFTSGPLHYATSIGSDYFIDFEFYFLIFDIIAFLFYTAIAAAGAWLVWSELYVPLRDVFTHPITHLSRDKTSEEQIASKRLRRMSLISFFIFPFVIYLPLIGAFLILDKLGMDVRDSYLAKIMAMGGLIGGTILLAKRFKVEPVLVFIGMAFWMIALIIFIFNY